ncbi:hypothetical protein ACKU07_23400 [Enterobacter hormaechei]
MDAVAQNLLRTDFFDVLNKLNLLARRSQHLMIPSLTPGILLTTSRQYREDDDFLVENIFDKMFSHISVALSREGVAECWWARRRIHQ